MNYFFVTLLSLAGFLSLKNEKDKRRKNIYLLIYCSLIAVVVLFSFGEFIGKMLYQIQYS